MKGLETQGESSGDFHLKTVIHIVVNVSAIDSSYFLQNFNSFFNSAFRY